MMATETKAQTLNTNTTLILCIAGSKNCDAEMARQPALVRAIKTGMANQEFRVRVELIEIYLRNGSAAIGSIGKLVRECGLHKQANFVRGAKAEGMETGGSRAGIHSVLG